MRLACATFQPACHHVTVLEVKITKLANRDVAMYHGYRLRPRDRDSMTVYHDVRLTVKIFTWVVYLYIANG